MAVVSATSNGTVENDRKGWLLKRTHFTYRWKLAWFELKDSLLVYGDNEKRLHKAINLVGAEMEPLEGNTSFGWTITPGDSSHRTFFLRASTEEEQQQWMEAICEAQLRSGEQGPNACVLQ
ncbi:hypothetical protein AALO_G00107560 [Alosa alosa]|uniref:PH domain-containing protein n=1 Tax=Alosa alosa TaxID=278164 RepID=A0AAV6GRM1_9TELE|nr:pleckstrin homology-like domain-containing protein [Alosa sapidissima]XP_048107051.1 pleckstrin homology-like domain-containing protein [Alosa alosa]KAG5276602.1 hypothetical protein AALO_G00107560 [Alosa alosa]